MPASKHARTAPRKSTGVQNLERKAVSAPDLVGSNTRARTRQGIVIKDSSLLEGADIQEVKYTEDLEVYHDEDRAASDFEVVAKTVLDIATGSVERPATPNGPRKRQKTKVIKAGENQEAHISEDTLKRVRLGVKEEEEGQVNEVSPIKIKRKRKGQGERETQDEVKEPLTDEGTPKTTKRKRQAKQEKAEDEEEDEVGEEVSPKKVKRKRKTKEEKEAEAMPIAARTVSLRMYVGAHVSSAKGVHNAVTNCVHIGGNAFALFLKSQRKWENPPLQDEHKVLFKSHCKEHTYDAASHVVPHGSYLVNLAQEDPERANQAYTSFLEDLNRCEDLGIKLYNFHPGSTGPSTRPSAIARIAASINRAHIATKTVKPLLENMAGAGNVIGSTFEDLRDIISLVEDKSRIGVCLDTCHSFAAGYDLRSKEAFQETLGKFDEVVGMKYLSALHLNDSKAPFGSHRDLHQNIGLGFLGLRAFHNVMNEPRFEGLPMVLETPIDSKDEDGKDIEDKRIWAREIKMLEGLIGTDVESESFKAMEKELADKGAEERAKYQEQFERKLEKEKKATEKERKSMADWLKKGAGKEGGKRKRRKKGDEEEEEEDVESEKDL